MEEARLQQGEAEVGEALRRCEFDGDRIRLLLWRRRLGGGGRAAQRRLELGRFLLGRVGLWGFLCLRLECLAVRMPFLSLVSSLSKSGR